jgi:hypothetical protein
MRGRVEPITIKCLVLPLGSLGSATVRAILAIVVCCLCVCRVNNPLGEVQMGDSYVI